MNWKEWFYFNRTERWGLISLLVMSIILLLIPHFIFDEKRKEIFFEPIEIDSKPKKSKSQFAKVDERKDPEKKLEKEAYFSFDPNTLTKDSFMLLGLSPKISSNILKYRDVGGRFRTAESFSKVYGLTKEKFEKLLPYISIKEKPKPEKKEVAQDEAPKEQDYKKYEKYPTVRKTIDINTASVEEFIELPCIASGYANRIVSTRSRVGGFLSKESMKKWCKLPDSTFECILERIEVKTPAKKFNINVLSWEELSGTPFFKPIEARMIDSHRKNHGNYNSISDLKSACPPCKNLDELEGYLVWR
jgi:competence protein ComEA